MAPTTSSPKLALFGKLVQSGLISERQLEECHEAELETGESLDRALKNKGYVTETKLFELYQEALGLPLRTGIAGERVPKAYTTKVPVHFARANNLIAIGEQEGVYTVATCEPMELAPLDEISAMLDAEVELVLAPRSEITSLINKSYQMSSDGVAEMLEGLDEDEILGAAREIEASEDVLDIANKAPVIRLVNMIMFEALKNRASDIHLQPYEDHMQVRYRIDGILYDSKIIPKKVQDAIVSRIKVMGKMDIAERRRPQGGRTTIRIGDGEVDLRISSVPTNSGERIVMRILDKTQKLYPLETIGLSPANLDLVMHVINYPNGIIFVTGPTGSGKTTTLYASISKLNAKDKNIMTIEDPIEYHLAGVSQIQVNNKAGLSFAAGLREVLRQDPDVMMVGEVRDEETARIAIQSALTGHLVFSTLHTNDAPSAMTRLIDIGVEPYLVASSVVCVVAQRLVRLICKECREEYTPSEQEVTEVGLTMEQLGGRPLYLGMGCSNCYDTGYVERTAIYEVMMMDEKVRELVLAKAGASRIKQVAVQHGLRTLRMDGARTVLEGRTTIEEVMRVTQMDVF